MSTRKVPPTTSPTDAVVAMALAYWRASLGAGVSVYSDRGLLAV